MSFSNQESTQRTASQGSQGGAGAAIMTKSSSSRSLGGGSSGSAAANGSASVGRRSTQRQSTGGGGSVNDSSGGYGASSPPKKVMPKRISIEDRAAARAAKIREQRAREKSTVLEDYVVPEWQPTSSHVNSRGMRPDITPFGRNPKLYKFRDAPPSSKGWGLAAGDELGAQFDKIDVTPSGNPRFHSFRDAQPTSKGWHLVSGDELRKTEVKVDTTPLGSNIKNFKFRSNGKRKFNVVKKTQKPLISYFE